ncbi:Ig-like domain-containing protein [Deinococcus aestuarii]|uniref:Ig-like domain-containing protein n=1 Tax=Deinococcus aestuarii TaxID=2774531 RepID=UPI001C0D4CE0|nr:Ig-like domain-containing protein [Deinococcus aestuarii]
MPERRLTHRSPSRVGLALTLAVALAACSSPPSAPNPKGEVPGLPAGGALINFQPAGVTPPTGYTADTGAPYDPARGHGWITEASAGSGSPVPLDVTPNTRDRALPGVDARLNTFIHMQFPADVSNSTAVRTPAAWEYALPNGTYSVTVAVGDAGATSDGTDQINVEGQPAVVAFRPGETQKFATTTLRATVRDGRLTVDARGGTNTKIDYVLIRPGDRPSVRDTHPQDGQTAVATTTPVTVDLNLPNSGVDLGSLTPSAVRLLDPSGNRVPAALNTSGGGDAVVLQPNAPLQANARYTFEITADLKDTDGRAFLPTSLSFVTGASAPPSALAFEQVELPNAPARPYTSVEMGPDGRLYAATLTGEILRFGVQPDGTLGAPQVITSVQAANGGPRTIIGMRFDPAATADNPVLWISNNHFWDGRSEAPDWSGKITRLSGPNLETVQDYVVGLPRSIRDHETNAVSFRPGERDALYILQGSNTAMGAPDTAWGDRPEHLLNAALLRLDLSKLSASSLPLDVRTEDGGTYNPSAPGAPLTLYASGIRNAYDMVWHTNGQLYVPTNGSAAGGNTPGTPASLPAACQNRPDGPYSGPGVPALTNVGVQHDFLFRITPGGYYGHPNPQRCEWVMNGGNPTAGADPAEVGEYPAGTLPDRNWRGFAYDFGEHASPNGVIEEYTGTPGSPLRHKLLVVRYSAGKDIIVLTPGANGDIASSQTLVTGLTNFSPSPLDLTEDRASGRLYVAQLDEQTGSGKLTLVRLK